MKQAREDDYNSIRGEGENVNTTTSNLNENEEERDNISLRTQRSIKRRRLGGWGPAFILLGTLSELVTLFSKLFNII